MDARTHRMLAAGLLALALLHGEARAGSIISEASAGKGFLGINLIGDIPLIQDRTFLTLCAATSRTTPQETTADPQDAAVDQPKPPAVYQLCAGVDHALNDNWILSATLNGSPRSSVRVNIFPNDFLYFRSDNTSVGASFAAAYMSDWDSPVEWGFDVGAGATAYFVPHSWASRLSSGLQVYSSPGRLVTLRPTAGINVSLGEHVELGLRGAYNLYSQNPLAAGRVTDKELMDIGAALHTRLAPSQLAEITAYLARYLDNLPDGISRAAAVSGLALAPIWYELRPALTYRFNEVVRAQLSYSYERYVPTQGYAHVLSTRWSFRLHDSFRTWAAAALQFDVPEDLDPALSVLWTLGAEYDW